MLAVNVDGMVFRLHDREHLARADVMSNIAFCVPITAFVVVGALIDEGILFDDFETVRVEAGDAAGTPAAGSRGMKMHGGLSVRFRS